MFERLELMIKFYTVVTWSISNLLSAIEALHDNALYIGSNCCNDEYSELFKDCDRMMIQTIHLKRLMVFLQREFASYPDSEQITY